MTLPDERYRAVMQAKTFLESLAYDRDYYPHIGEPVRQEASRILRHFPGVWDMNRAAEAAPDVFAEKMEPVTRLMAQYVESKK